jgi:hypothetical protein
LFSPKFPWSIETQSKSDSIPLGTSAAIARWNTWCVPQEGLIVCKFSSHIC